MTLDAARVSPRELESASGLAPCLNHNREQPRSRSSVCLGMRVALSMILALGCARQSTPVVAPSAQRHPPAYVVTPPRSLWPVAMRVMTWTKHGIVQIGELPGSPPAAVPVTPWYVEPSAADHQLRETALDLAGHADERLEGLRIDVEGPFVLRAVPFHVRLIEDAPLLVR
jgi:hypothetical protein